MSEREGVRKAFGGGNLLFIVSKQIYEVYFPKAEEGYFDYYNGMDPFEHC